ncbi:hypothetical protein ACJX0J_032983, partial [Zea mays]
NSLGGTSIVHGLAYFSGISKKFSEVNEKSIQGGVAMLRLLATFGILDLCNFGALYCSNYGWSVLGLLCTRLSSAIIVNLESMLSEQRIQYNKDLPPLWTPVTSRLWARGNDQLIMSSVVHLCYAHLPIIM